MFFYKVIHWIIYFLFKNQAAEVKGLENLPRNDGFIIAANHGTAYDPLIIITVLRNFLRRYFNPRMKKMYFLGSTRIKHRILRYSIATVLVNVLDERIGYLPANCAGLTRAVELLGQGHIVVIFPEGRQNAEKQLLRGRRGVSIMALLSAKEIIPTGCFGIPAFSFREFHKLRSEEKRVVFDPGFFLTSLDKSVDATTNTIMWAISKVSNKDYPFSR
ncbi:1-acyl-sn-glycerol-3-phosphate acyltransferase [Patescibacteria group bacterium]|nr:1-acyl-sn-glycerol-3-phosphate acyltransferase [Patescibacteria group bacterium]MBU4458854.1 1-acyl-sn-glycerol-3-phosphate acyltransferase [Patescibacteria group bacterium]MCG2696139.1 1-acyl-sn-glycerol-3-phosphate acyltransferase [Candidatus Portnoybacteria bacterium]